jgi:hypothetical protein
MVFAGLVVATCITWWLGSESSSSIAATASTDCSAAARER